MIKKGKNLINYNLPVGAHISVEENQKIKLGSVLAKIPRTTAKAGDITGGLPRITELLKQEIPLILLLLQKLMVSFLMVRLKEETEKLLLLQRLVI